MVKVVFLTYDILAKVALQTDNAIAKVVLLADVAVTKETRPQVRSCCRFPFPRPR